MKLCPEQQELLTQIMQAQFAFTEWTLYVNTHPWDNGAITTLNCYGRQLAMLEAQYAAQFGPLTCSTTGPFPWEIEYY